MQTLVFIRLAGMFIGVLLVLWSFMRYRQHLFSRVEFILFSLIGFGLFTVSLFPSTVNALAAMMALKGEAYSRLIALLILSNMALWVWFFYHRGRDAQQDRQFDLLTRKVALGSLRAGDKGSIKPVTVIIPALNEADNLREVLARMPKEVCGLETGVLVVDDGSDDGTGDVAVSMGFMTIENPMNRGGGAACRLGYDVAIAGGADIVVTMDADGQHLPEEIEGLVRPIVENELDFVIGSRVLGEREKDSKMRVLGVHVFSTLINLLAGTNISDCSSGYRAFSVNAIRKIHLVQDQYYAPEAIIDAGRKGVRLGEVPITILKRRHGESKKGRNLFYGLKFARTILKSWWR